MKAACFTSSRARTALVSTLRVDTILVVHRWRRTDKSMSNLTNSSAPRVTITNVAIFGSGGFQGDTATYPIQTIYTATLFKDKHQIKVGGDYLYSHLRWAFFSALTGKYNFASLANFQRGLYSTY